jgi:hypothetical protein
VPFFGKDALQQPRQALLVLNDQDVHSCLVRLALAFLRGIGERQLLIKRF